MQMQLPSICFILWLIIPADQAPQSQPRRATFVKTKPIYILRIPYDKARSISLSTTSSRTTYKCTPPCPLHLSCEDGSCVDPCIGACAANAQCRAVQHKPLCACPLGYHGDPLTDCIIDQGNPCNINPCGFNATCIPITKQRRVCNCHDGHVGDPETGCTHECEKHTDCQSNKACRNWKCVNPCKGVCSEKAICTVNDYHPMCSCPEGYQGDGVESCYKGCRKNSDCPAAEICKNTTCISACNALCGKNSICNVIDHAASCSCPEGYEGNPKKECKSMKTSDPCNEAPCGTNAECNMGKDENNNTWALCTCPEGYLGEPLVACQKAECTSNEECPKNRTCFDFTCLDPCFVCGAGASCVVEDHVAVCQCPEGFTGNHHKRCFRVRQQLNSEMEKPPYIP